MVIWMQKPWFQKLFGRPSTPRPAEGTQSKVDHDDAEAQFTLGSRFADGTGTPPDSEQAAHWFLKAAHQDYAPAQFSLAMMFGEGQGVPRNDGEAMQWFLKAARQGHAGAQHHLGLRRRRAGFQGMPDDLLESNIEAYKWFRLAAAQGYKGSDAQLEPIALTMTREQVIEGDQRAARFVVERPKLAEV